MDVLWVLIYMLLPLFRVLHWCMLLAAFGVTLWTMYRSLTSDHHRRLEVIPAALVLFWLLGLMLQSFCLL